MKIDGVESLDLAGLLHLKNKLLKWVGQTENRYRLALDIVDEHREAEAELRRVRSLIFSRCCSAHAKLNRTRWKKQRTEGTGNEG